MWNEPTGTELRRLPRLYETDGTSLEDKVIGMHFFLGACDWYAVEYSPADRVFFGYANLGNDRCAEWGYFSLDELVSLRTRQGFEVDRDLHWTPTKARYVDRMR